MHWAFQIFIATSFVLFCEGGFIPFKRFFSTDPDVGRNVTQIIANRGYPYEEHHVTTEDGFILAMQRIPRGRGEKENSVPKEVVFLQHGILADATNWVMDTPTKSLAYILADSGFDVWLGNIRGNDYSRRHVKYDPDQCKFWNWSWQEMAHYDLPAMINYALQVTGQEKLFYVGHSQGTLIAFNGFADNPALGNKIKAFFALAPIYTLNNSSEIAKGGAEIIYPLVKKLFPGLTFDLLPGRFLRALIKLGFCSNPLSERVCYDFMELVIGMDSDNVEKSRVPVYLAHFAEGTSFKDVVHFGQIIVNKKCQKFDYGEAGNKKHYNQATAPMCQVQNMPTPTLLFVGGDDGLGDPADVQALKPKISNLVHYEVIPGWNHLDFLYGIDASKILYPKIVSVMKSVH
ncbi:lipase member K-like [Oculina patagonica]